MTPFAYAADRGARMLNVTIAPVDKARGIDNLGRRAWFVCWFNEDRRRHRGQVFFVTEEYLRQLYPTAAFVDEAPVCHDCRTNEAFTHEAGAEVAW